MFQPRQMLVEMARRGVSTEDLAGKSGLSMSTIYKVLKPRANPTARTLEKIADALNVEVGLFFEDDLHHGVKQARTA